MTRWTLECHSDNFNWISKITNIRSVDPTLTRYNNNPLTITSRNITITLRNIYMNTRRLLRLWRRTAARLLLILSYPMFSTISYLPKWFLYSLEIVFKISSPKDESLKLGILHLLAANRIIFMINFFLFGCYSNRRRINSYLSIYLDESKLIMDSFYELNKLLLIFLRDLNASMNNEKVRKPS